MAAHASAFSFTFTVDGAITTVVVDDPVEEQLARQRDRDASKKKTDSDAPAKKRSSDAGRKRVRDGGLDRGEESDEARGWSSAVVERGLALRRRGGSASCCRPRRGLIVGEVARSCEEAAASALGDGEEAAAAAVAAEKLLPDPTLEFFYLAVLSSSQKGSTCVLLRMFINQMQVLVTLSISENWLLFFLVKICNFSVVN